MLRQMGYPNYVSPCSEEPGDQMANYTIGIPSVTACPQIIVHGSEAVEIFAPSPRGHGPLFLSPRGSERAFPISVPR